MAGRRLKRFLLTLDDLTLLLRGTHAVSLRPLPPDAVVVFPPAWNAVYGSWEITVRSEEYPEITPVSIIPLDNGPVIEECPS